MRTAVRRISQSARVQSNFILQRQAISTSSQPSFLGRLSRTARAPRRLECQTLKSQRLGQRYYSDAPKPDVTTQLKSPKPETGLKAKLKELFKKYGYVSVGVYLALSALDFPFCFLAVRLAGPERIGQIEHQVLSSLKGISEPVWQVIKPVAAPIVDAVKDATTRVKQGAVQTVAGGESSSAVSTEATHEAGKDSASIWTQLALAYGIHKTLLIFVRVPLTAALTPRVARTLQSWGWKVGSKSAT